jgi:predicted RNA binding protein YcfA (HicA-like mRNA interferase family)
MTREELVALRQRAGNLRSQDLVDAAERCGYSHARTKGGHHAYSKPGVRTLIIPDKLTSGTARGIINRLIGELES